MTPRLRQSAVLARMLLVFFRRRVLRAGALRSTEVRVCVGAAAVLLLAAMCTAGYLFLRPLAGDSSVWRLLFDTSTVSLLLWVQIAFLLVKVLFLNAGGMLRLSWQLPVTNRERAAAFLLYEAAMTGALAAAGLLSLTVSALLLLGPAALPYLTAAVILPAALAYLALSVLYQLLTRGWALLGLGRIGELLAVLVLFALLTVYAVQLKTVLPDISQAYLDKRTRFVWVTSVSWAWQRYGAAPTLLTALLLVALLLVLTLALAPDQHIRQSRYLNLRAGNRLGRMLGPYDWCLLRSSQTVVGVVLAVALYGVLLAYPAVNPMWSCAVLPLGGLYQFTATQPLRMLPGPGAAVSARRTYGRLLRAQAVLLTGYAVPALALVLAVDPRLFTGSGPALLGALGGAVTTTCISVVFPAERDNPLSVFLGLSVVTVALAGCAIGVGLFSLPPWATMCALAGAALLFVRQAVHGIDTHESRRRNDKGTVGSEMRRRGRAADAGHHGDHAAVSDVLHGR